MTEGSRPELPSLVAVASSGELARLLVPVASLAKEPFVLGVLSFEVERTGRRVTGKLRGAVTGRPPLAPVPLNPGEPVHVFLHRQGQAPELPDPPVPYVGGGALGGGAVFVDGKPVSVMLLEGRRAFDHPPPRSGVQIYCRWVRGGDLELGLEVTDFGGPKLVSRFVEKRSVISFALLGG